MALIAPRPKISAAWNTQRLAENGLPYLMNILFSKPKTDVNGQGCWILAPASLELCSVPFPQQLSLSLRQSWKAGSASPPLGMSCPESPAPQLLPQPWQWPPSFSTPQRERFRFHTALSNEKFGQMVIFIHVKILIGMFENMAMTQNSQTLNEAGRTDAGWGRRLWPHRLGRTDSPSPPAWLSWSTHLTFLSLCSLTCKMRLQIAPVS